MTRLKAGNEQIKLVPRVLFDGWTKSDYLELFSDSAIMMSLGKFMAQQLKVSHATIVVCICVYIIKTCGCYMTSFQSHGFDGAVLEVWSQLGGHHRK